MTRSANRRRSTRVIAAIGGATVLVALAACGQDGAEAISSGAGPGTGPVAAAGSASVQPAGLALRTKAEVIEIGGGYCRVAERRASAVPYQTTEDPFGPAASAADRAGGSRFLAAFADALEFSRAGLSGLEAPADGRDLLTAYVEGLAGVIQGLRTASSAQNAASADAAFAAFDEISAKTAEYGFPSGVCGAGDDDGSEGEGATGAASDASTAPEDAQSEK